jgi:hypothetical protein
MVRLPLLRIFRLSRAGVTMFVPSNRIADPLAKVTSERSFTKPLLVKVSIPDNPLPVSLLYPETLVPAALLVTSDPKVKVDVPLLRLMSPPVPLFKPADTKLPAIIANEAFREIAPAVLVPEVFTAPMFKLPVPAVTETAPPVFVLIPPVLIVEPVAEDAVDSNVTAPPNAAAVFIAPTLRAPPAVRLITPPVLDALVFRAPIVIAPVVLAVMEPPIAPPPVVIVLDVIGTAPVLTRLTFPPILVPDVSMAPAVDELAVVDRLTLPPKAPPPVVMVEVFRAAVAETFTAPP